MRLTLFYVYMYVYVSIVVAPKKTGKKKEMKSHIEDQEDSAQSNLQLTEVLREGESALDYRQFNPSWCPAEWGVFLKHCPPSNFLSESDTCKYDELIYDFFFCLKYVNLVYNINNIL